jgi:hypothetical protein
MAAPALLAPPLIYCDRPSCCSNPIPYYDAISLDGATLCPEGAFRDAAEMVAPLLSPTFSPLPAGLRSAEEGLRVLRMLLARAEARVRDERAKAVR